MARGIPENEARGLLDQGVFIAEIIEELEDETLVEALQKGFFQLNRQMRRSCSSDLA